MSKRVGFYTPFFVFSEFPPKCLLVWSGTRQGKVQGILGCVAIPGSPLVVVDHTINWSNMHFNVQRSVCLLFLYLTFLIDLCVLGLICFFFFLGS